MAITNNTTKYFEGNNPISFRSLSTTFGGAEADGSVRFSKYKRDETSDTPVVPDAVENVNISSEDNLSIEDFRGAIKEYEVVQTGSDENIQFQTYFNNNLTRNVSKRLSIAGTCFSTDVTEFAATLDADAQDVLNLDIDVSATGQILGAGGSPNVNSGSGGGALYVQSGSNTRNFNLNISPGGQVWAGGGAGADGTDGNTVTATCNQTRSTTERRETTSVRRGGSYPLTQTLLLGNHNVVPQRWTSLSNAEASLAQDCERRARQLRDSGQYDVNSARVFDVNGANQVRLDDYRPGTDEVCRGTGRAGARQGCARRINWNCAYVITIRGVFGRNQTTGTTRQAFTVTNNHSENVSALGGTGGIGGLGQGYQQSQSDGNPGTAGGTTPCRSGWTGTGAIGNPGNPGTSGGDWGEDGEGTGAGQGGDALSYSAVSPTIRGESANTFKGKKSFRP